MPDRVGPLEVDGSQVRPLAVVEVPRDPLHRARRGEDLPHRHDRVLQPASLPPRARQLLRAHPEVRGEIGVGDPPLVLHDMQNAVGKRRGNVMASLDPSNRIELAWSETKKPFTSSAG